jgi:hypothetical protein
MKSFFLFIIIVFSFIISAQAQTQKGNVLVGGDIGHLNLDFQPNNTIFSMTVNPEIGWFIGNNRMLGVQLSFGLATEKGSSTANYGIGAFGRSYFGCTTTDLVRKTKWFIEVNAGLFGTNSTGTDIPHTSTNGLGLGVGPGLSYFVTSNVALEALAKYNLTVGFGNATTDNAINASFGFQIYLHGRGIRTIAAPRQ